MNTIYLINGCAQTSVKASVGGVWYLNGAFRLPRMGVYLLRISICALLAHVTIPPVFAENYNYYQGRNSKSIHRASTANKACQGLNTGNLPAATAKAAGTSCYIDTYGTRYVVGFVYLVFKSCSEGVVDLFCTPSKQKGAPEEKICSLKGNPINIAIGNKFQHEVDYATAGVSPLTMERTYNSIDGVWRHNHSASLQVSKSQIVMTTGDGRGKYFIPGSETAVSISGDLGEMRKAGNTWVYTSGDNKKFSFNADGQLVRVDLPSGDNRKLSYSNGQITITDSFGRKITVTEDNLQQPLSMVGAGINIQYTYGPQRQLTKVVSTIKGEITQKIFHYEDSRNPKLLTGITDERGTRYATWSYDAESRAISSEHANGADKVLISYSSDGSSTVTNELGKKTTYRFAELDGIKRITAIEGEPSANCPNSNSTFTYDSRGLLKTKTDNKDHLTTFDYNERGLEVSRTEASGTPQARTVTTEWHPTLFLPVTVTEPSRITHYTYDDQGRRLSQVQTDR